MAVIEAIQTTYLEAEAASVTFSSLGSNEHLQLRISGRATHADDLQWLNIRFNGDTGSNYSYHHMMGFGSAIDAGGTASWTAMAPWRMAASNLNATEYDPMIIAILDYRNANKNTTMQGMAGYGFTHSTTYVRFASGVWDNTAAVTSIVVYPQAGSWTRGSEFTLYGLNSS